MSAKTVFIFSPGGLAAKGGMGRMVAILAGRLGKDTDIAYEVVDTYGPRVNLPGSKRQMPVYFAAAVFRLLLACLRAEIGLAHIHMAANGSVYRKCVLLFICHAFAVPAIVHIHGGNLDTFCTRRGVGFFMLVIAFRQVRQVVVLGEYWRQLVVTSLSVDPARVSLLPNAISAPPEPGPRATAPDCELLFLGYVTPEKGMDDLLAALSSAELSARKWRLTVAGGGMVERYRDIAETLGIADRITFLGWVSENEVDELLWRADLLVLPSHFECLPMCIIEAMAHGLPVVATAVGAVPEAVIEGDTGLLVPVASPAELGHALTRLIDAPLERQRLGRNARQHFSAKFDLEALHARLREMYMRHLAEPERT